MAAGDGAAAGGTCLVCPPGGDAGSAFVLGVGRPQSALAPAGVTGQPRHQYCRPYPPPAIDRGWLAAAYADAAYADDADDANDADVWRNVRADCELLASATHRESLRPLWDETPDWVAEYWAQVKTAYTADHWRVWLDWYERALAGEPQNWDLIQEIALQPDDFWDGPDEDINREILALAEKYDQKTTLGPGALAEGEQRSPHGEDLVKNDQDKFDTRPVQASIYDLFEMVKRAIQNCATDMRTLLAQRQSYPLEEVIARIETELTRSSDAPVLIFDAIREALQIIDARSSDGSLEMDYRVRAFRQRLDDASIDLRQDPEVRKYQDARAAYRVPQFGEIERETIKQFAEAVAKVSAERLGGEMADDSKTGTNPNMPEEQRGDALYRFGSRYIRMERLDSPTVTVTANSITIGSQLPAVADWIRQTVLQWFL